MSNRTDFDHVARELCEFYGLDSEKRHSDVALPLVERIETELHDAFVAGQEARDSDALKLRAALKEALDKLEGWVEQEYCGTSMHDAEMARVVELRKLVES